MSQEEQQKKGKGRGMSAETPMAMMMTRHSFSSEASSASSSVSSPPHSPHRRRHFAPSPPNPNHHYRPRLPFHLWASSLFLLLFPIFIIVVFTVHSTTTTLSAFPSTALKMTSPVGSPGQRPLRIMSFNIWVSGTRVENGMEKIANQIKEVDPDIVALQEVSTPEVARNLTELLGPTKWKCLHHPFAKYPDTAIVTKHKFVLEKEAVHLQFERQITDFLFNEEHYENNSITTYGMGATIQLEPDGQLVNFYSMHLDWRSYGPYAANNKQVTNGSQIMIGERNKEGYGRAQNMEQLLANDEFKKHLKLSDKQPLIVAGDFNAPSHLDWTEETKDIHGGWTFEWPATKLIMDAGLKDSFRVIHPDVVKEPGITWSTVQKSVGPEWDWEIPEPQDRIDFIFFKPSDAIRVVKSHTYAGADPLKPIPYQSNNTWPSDHFAVVTEFVINLADDAETRMVPMANDVHSQLNNTINDGMEMDGPIEDGQEQQ